MGLPDWLEPLPDAAAQRALDSWAIEQRHVPALELMERAGRGLAELVAQRIPQGVIAVVCGHGSNGGDGLVAARLLRELGREVDVQLIGGGRELTDDARANCERLPGAPPRPFNPGSLMEVAGVVDAVLGTGARGAPRGEASDAVETMAAADERGVPVVACDVPSGVDASTGEVAGPAVRAVATVTFHAGKPGLWIAPGKQHAGEVTVVEIGIPGDGPPARPRAAGAAIGLIGGGVLAHLPERGLEATKFDGGSVLVCGGSPGLTGAPSMAAEAAARTGAGYVTALVPAALNLVFELRDAEVMSVPLADLDGSFSPQAADVALARCERADALVLGPGLGRSPGAASFARELALHAPLPLLLDADGLNAHATEAALERLAGRTAATVLTPHGGELARLMGRTSDDVRTARLRYAREAARRAGAIVVLKGDDTLVVEPEGRVAVSRGDAPALATAGTGDVLSGVIGALLARGIEPFTAACAGVELHRRAGRLVGARVGVEGAMARDTIAMLPYARRER
jgi:ADP-dependent NAD(P)H-hydrate dehydratase / NAD(P)H-hydrate epimerase